MRLIIFILLLSLAVGYFVTYHVIKDPVAQWYAYFVTNDLKAFLLSIALMVVTYKKKEFPFAFSAGIVCAYDLITQIGDFNQKGNWADEIYRLLIILITAYVAFKYFRADH